MGVGSLEGLKGFIPELVLQLIEGLDRRLQVQKCGIMLEHRLV